MALENLSNEKAFVYSLALIALIFPGFGILYSFHNDLLLTLDWPRLLIFSIYFSLPIFTGSLLVSFLQMNIEDKIGQPLEKDLMIPVVVTAGSVYALIIFLICLFGFKSPDIRNLYLASAGCLCLFMLGSGMRYLFAVLNKKFQNSVTKFLFNHKDGVTCIILFIALTVLQQIL